MTQISWQSPEIYPNMYVQLIVDKNTKAVQWEKVFSTNGATKLYMHLEGKKKKNFDHSSYAMQKVSQIGLST